MYRTYCTIITVGKVGTYHNRTVPYLLLFLFFSGLEPVILEIRGAEVEFRVLVQRLLVHLDHEAVEVRHQTLHTLTKLLGRTNHIQSPRIFPFNVLDLLHFE